MGTTAKAANGDFRQNHSCIEKVTTAAVAFLLSYICPQFRTALKPYSNLTKQKAQFMAQNLP